MICPLSVMIDKGVGRVLAEPALGAGSMVGGV